MKNIIFVAPPAAGKGTCSEELTKRFNYKHISTGDLLREARIKGDDLGKKISDLMDSGQLVSDDIVLELLQRELKDNNQVFILDGYPRNISQAKTLDCIFKDLQIDDYVVIYLKIEFEKALYRTLGRLVCPKCKIGYNKNTTSLKPKVDGICDNCGEELITRNDDNEETFKIRFNNYINETEPVLQYYQEKNKLNVIDATLSVDEIMKEIEGVIVNG